MVRLMLQLMAVLLCHEAKVHIMHACVDEFCKHGNILEKGFIPDNCFKCIMSWTSDTKPFLLSLCFPWDGRVSTLVKLLATVPVIDVC